MNIYTVTFQFHNLEAIVEDDYKVIFYDWCIITFGKRGAYDKRWDMRGTYPLNLSFADRRDAIMFKLRWGQVVDFGSIHVKTVVTVKYGASDEQQA